MVKTREQIAELHALLDRLSDDEIKRRLAHGGIWTLPETRKEVELYLENKEIARRDRFTAKDRNIQQWILAVAVGALAATVLTWFLV